MIDEHRRLVTEWVEKLKHTYTENLSALARTRPVFMVSSGNLSYYVVKGRRGYYIVLPGLYCSCKEFEINVLMRRSKGACYHLALVNEAIKQGRVKELELKLEEANTILIEVLETGDSMLLRRAASGVGKEH